MIKPLSVKILMYLLNQVSKVKLLNKISPEQSHDLVLCYHDVGNSNWEFIVTKNNFKKQINFLVKKFNVVGLREILKSNNLGRKPRVAITFDDGLSGVYKNAFPILEKLGVPATVFLIRGNLGTTGYMHITQIKKLIKSGWEIGYHTASHKDLTKLTGNALIKEIGGKNILEKELGVQISYFAYPHGKYKNETVSIVSKSNFLFAFTTSGRKVSHLKKYKFILGRITISNFFSQDNFESLFTTTGFIINLIFTYFWSLKDNFNDFTRYNLRNIKRDLILIYKAPTGYFFSFLESTTEKVGIENYDPRSTLVGRKIVRDIKKHIPNLKVHFHGSSALQIQGQNDIDLLLEGKLEEFDKFLPELTQLFGKPIKRGKKYIEWHFRREKYKVELLLIDPKSRMFKELITVYLVLRSDKKLLKEYEQIKLNSNGLSPREYQKNRLEFYNKLLSVKLS
ncbi:hypothetical protein A2715_04515 [Candidatus Woesebacteria bacterium RIFCSPHIGHO2_01_FULL_39_32]|uniref:Polysaccharide deacetylase family protein n=2 Tax=Candidatus Woeseibacteriota TaxID=1752722 RepID=A0A0G0PR81_9BACT|nr:MAG: Polysaccharide deacetylase family protein [Candidatus Woesebacteria bacterium GW2011_GWA1_39_8]OGM25280.1 MAG: hypothetical protein A2715_04515 [Candidatus Woesebacteria bacterium RIFCSPHIGHO2_01_FULL_39_32]OGM37779.1 MAG: hypothetical protein A3F01_01725 [Candidatus Woesebacteria bacterium RIFCSPHIGHO2_12_FULL_38_11]OGM64811.1 MAG: hypothetical protein A2893_04125 [Candidatus Woesebacteria bacterium RIFCSPLOWO2_01_FULL_39_25]